MPYQYLTTNASFACLTKSSVYILACPLLRAETLRAWCHCHILIMSRSLKVSLGLFLLSVLPVLGENQCYYAKDKVGPSNLVPCTTEENSPCCLLGDRCFSGGVCISAEDVIYQYGCTDSTFESEACPFKCGWDDCTLISISRRCLD